MSQLWWTWQSSEYLSLSQHVCGCCPSSLFPILLFISTAQLASTEKRKGKKKKKKQNKEYPEFLDIPAPGGKHESTVSFIASWVSIQTSSVYPVTFAVLHFSLPFPAAHFKVVYWQSLLFLFQHLSAALGPPPWSWDTHGHKQHKHWWFTGIFLNCSWDEASSSFTRWREHRKIRKGYTH